MSMKILNVYKFDGTIEELMDYMKQYRKKWIQYKIDDIHDKILKYDLKSSMDYVKIYESIKEETDKNYNSWGDYFDIKASCTIIFYNNEIFCATFIDSNAPKFIDDRFSDWHYQNQSDPWFAYALQDKKITSEEYVEAEKEWLIREKMWKDLFSEDYCYDQIGLSYKFYSLFDPSEVALEVLKLLKKDKKVT